MNDYPPGAENDPNAPYNEQDREVIGACTLCGNTIYKDDSYAEIKDKLVCENCMYELNKFYHY